MQKKAILWIGILALMVFFVSSVLARVNYDTVEALIGDVNSLPLLRNFVVEKLGSPDSVETMVGFSNPAEIYIIEGSDELSHAYFVYHQGESGETTYAIGVILKEESGMNVENIINEAENAGMGGAIVFHRPGLAILDIFAGQTEKPLWILMEDREWQGKTVSSSTVISPESTLAYVEKVYGEETRKSLEKAIEERAQ